MAHHIKYLMCGGKMWLRTIFSDIFLNICIFLWLEFVLILFLFDRLIFWTLLMFKSLVLIFGCFLFRLRSDSKYQLIHQGSYKTSKKWSNPVHPMILKVTQNYSRS